MPKPRCWPEIAPTISAWAFRAGRESAGTNCSSGPAPLHRTEASRSAGVAHLRSSLDDQPMSTRTQGFTGAAAVLAAAAMLSVWGARGAASQSDSGVRGRVLYGPTCPSQRHGQNCFRPATGTISVIREPTGRLVARVRSSSNGHFTVPLAPGGYLLALLAPYTSNPGARTQKMITVRSHHFTSVTLNFDSPTR